MDTKRLERIADRILDVFADIRVNINDLIYVAMYVVIKTHNQPELRDRVLEFGEQVKWEITNERTKNGNNIQQ